MSLTKTGEARRAAARQPKLPWYAPYGDDPVVRYGGLAFLLVGLIFLSVAFCLHRADSRRTARAVGTVVGVQERWDSENGTWHYPVVQFTSGDGHLVRFRSSSGSRDVPRRGETVNVVYDPANATNAVSGSDGVFALVFGVIGALPALLGGFLLLGALVPKIVGRR